MAPVPLTVLLSSVGRRSQLVQCFREALRDLAVPGRVIGIDSSPLTAPAAHLVDHCYAAPRCTSPGFVDAVLQICRSEGVKLIIPTIDTELAVYAENRNRFQQQGISVAVSDPATISIACDKVNTHRWLVEHGFPTVRQADPAAVLSGATDLRFPVIVKPRWGSASAGVARVASMDMLRTVFESHSDLVVQEIAIGSEYTVNAFVNDQGSCVCAVPHRRLETRGGEVSKGITDKNPQLMKLAQAVMERLPGARGVLNLQCFLAPDESISIIEINARFGGGFPLANRAGAKFPRWLIEPLLGMPCTSKADWADKLLMLRYDSAVFVSGAEEV